MSWLAWLALGITIGGALGLAFMACLFMGREADLRMPRTDCREDTDEECSLWQARGKRCDGCPKGSNA